MTPPRGERRQNLARLREIAQVAARYGFGYLLSRGSSDGAGAGAVAPAPLSADQPDLRGAPRGRRVRAMLDELGPTFVKFGQLLSTRPDLLPQDIVQELRALQDAARPVPFEAVRGVMEEELGLRIEQVFLSFDEEPIAAASIGQVHRATLPGGQEVVVKVQRPDAERQIEADIQLLYQAARVAKERVKRLNFIDLVGLVDEFARSVRHELDYRAEARNAEVFRRNFADDETVHVPRIYWRQTSARMITMERVGGTSLAHLDLEALSLEDRRALAHRVAETWMKMVFLHGFFHADPHPANVLMQTPDRLALVDFGMVGQLTPRDRQAAVRLFLDIVDQEVDRLPRRLRELGVRYPPELEEDFRDQLAIILQRYYGVALAEIDARELLREVFQTIYRLNIELPARWALLDKAIATLAGVGLEIYPDFNVFETARPYARRMVTQRFRPDKVVERTQGNLERYAEAFLEYPFQVSELLQELRDGELRITIDQAGFSEHTDKIEKSANRLALALLALALFVASSLIGTLADAGPQVVGIAVISIPGFLAAFAVAAWLAFGIARSGRF
ncbi:MAG: ubiquinone biosynthesis protein [Miltoncostaeaceae bacterium]|jgi:ubiquinone biosynthesis protein|nr:ubiquinone biosynthesis protein [Miltoncostaeaceae bacterium]